MLVGGFRPHGNNPGGGPYRIKSVRITSMDIKLIIPAILGFGVSSLCPMNTRSGNDIPQRPASYVFGIIWPILYLLTGYSWSKTRGQADTHFLFLALISLLTLWPFVFSCRNDEKNSIFILALIIGTTSGIMSLHKDRKSVIALIPLLSWCIVALFLNWEIASKLAI
jgi:benzodiazapine receptor